jgi:hypothetical protein
MSTYPNDLNLDEFWSLQWNYYKTEQEQQRYDYYTSHNWIVSGDDHDDHDDHNETDNNNNLYTNGQLYGDYFKYICRNDKNKLLIRHLYRTLYRYQPEVGYKQIMNGCVPQERQSQGEHLKFPNNITSVISCSVGDFDSKARNRMTLNEIIDQYLLLGRIENKYFLFVYSETGKYSGDQFRIWTTYCDVKLYVCDNYRLLVDSDVMSNKYQLLLNINLINKQRKLASMVYYKFIERMSKPPYGYYFLKDVEKQLSDAKSPDYEQFKQWRQEHNYQMIKHYLQYLILS